MRLRLRRRLSALGLVALGLFLVSKRLLWNKKLDQDEGTSGGKPVKPVKHGEHVGKTFADSRNESTTAAVQIAAPVAQPKLVLFYTSLFGRLPWPGLDNSRNFTHWAHKPCGVRACQITYDKRRFEESDVVLFHGRDMPRVEKMRQLSKRRHGRQKWLYFVHESPQFLYYDPAMYNGFFNWTMSYRRDSDFFVPYRTYTRLSSEDQIPEANKNCAVGKERLVVWLASHCGYEREGFVRKLMRYVSVDVFGACRGKFNQTKVCRRRDPECGQLLKRYKFHLSFENSFCADYITEKYWRTPFNHDIVPVVLGGANYDSAVAIPGSFINVADFPSIKALADYLLYLDKNDDAYSRFFRWKEKFKPVLPESWTCAVCAAVNNSTVMSTSTVYHNLQRFWAPEHACGMNQNKVRQMLADAA